MPQINMIIAGLDEEYIKNLANWFRENRPQQFRVSVFTEKDCFTNYLSDENEKPDLILAEEAFICSDLEKNNNIIILGESCGEKYSDIKCVAKYQSAPGIASAVLTILSECGKVSKWDKSGKSEIIVCLSPDPALKSTIALYLALACENAVYINFESFPVYRLHPENNYTNKSLSDILYHIKSSKGNTAIALDSAVYSDYMGLNFIPPIDNPNDMWEMTESEIDALVKALKSWGHFKLIVADIELNAGPYTAKWLEAASTILVPLSPLILHQKQRVNNMIKSLAGTTGKNLKWIQSAYLKNESFEEPGNVCCIQELKPLPGDWKPYVQSSSLSKQIYSIIFDDK